MQEAYQIILCTCPDKETAEKIANTLVTDKLAACVNIVPGITSVFSWQGQVQSDQESLLLIKTRADFYPQVESGIKSIHPYELPEIVAVPVQQGLPEYLQWINSWISSE